MGLECMRCGSPLEARERFGCNGRGNENADHVGGLGVELCMWQVLDEIHRQSVALSRSATVSRASLPAPSTVVDGFPTRIHLSKSAVACTEAVQ